MRVHMLAIKKCLLYTSLSAMVSLLQSIFTFCDCPRHASSRLFLPCFGMEWRWRPQFDSSLHLKVSHQATRTIMSSPVIYVATATRVPRVSSCAASRVHLPSRCKRTSELDHSLTTSRACACSRSSGLDTAIDMHSPPVLQPLWQCLYIQYDHPLLNTTIMRLVLGYRWGGQFVHPPGSRRRPTALIRNRIQIRTIANSKSR